MAVMSMNAKASPAKPLCVPQLLRFRTPSSDAVPL